MNPERKQILIVEDDRCLRRACEIGLRKRGYAVTVAENGAEGLDLALERRFDLVLLDLLMPRMSGLDMLRALRADARGVSVPVLILSNSSRDGDRLEADRLGVAGYFVKACLSLDALGQVVKSLTTEPVQ